jgi:uncharacterized DUF497 family protein
MKPHCPRPDRSCCRYRHRPCCLRGVDFDQLRRENLEKDAVNFDELREENRNKVDFDQLRRENLDKDAVDFDQLRRENLDKDAVFEFRSAA